MHYLQDVPEPDRQVQSPQALARDGPDHARGKPRATGSRFAVWPATLALAALIALALMLVAWPAAVVVWDLVSSPAEADASSSSWSTGSSSARAWAVALARSMLYAGLIGLFATLMGWPAAWFIRSWGRDDSHRPGAWRRHVAAALVLSPLLMPSYLAYAGWGFLRGPGTLLGDFLGGREPWVNILAGQVAAVWGLALWAWPIATLVMLPRLRRIDDESLDALRMFARGRWRLWRSISRVQSPALLRSAVLITLIMLGSAIPLHVAQVETYTNELWKRLQLTGSARDMWAASWPTIAVAGLAAWFVMRSILTTRRADEHNPDAEQPGAAGGIRAPAALWVRALAAIVWLASVVAPAALFAYSLRQRRSLSEFWTFNTQALLDSASVALVAAALAFALCMLVWFVRAESASGRSPARATLRLTTLLFLFAALAPGILIGAAFERSWLSTLADGRWSFLAVAGAHAARFALVPVVVGLALAAIEGRDLRDARRQHGSWSLRSFYLAHARANWPVALGAALAVGCLSLHEIEAAVMAQPPGLDSLARTVLDYLHFARDEQLSAAALNLLAVGSLFACAAGLLLGRLLRPR
ncbi:MAG: hypothetical protein KF768_10655 [Phycisphaeraceae bacterium]|nr:hypothetical protein [Phycisphaeraceae bacterium]